MKVLFLLHEVAFAGAGKAAFLLITALKKMGIECVVVLPKRGALGDLMEKNGIKCIYIRFFYIMIPPFLRNPFKDKLLFFPKLARKVAEKLAEEKNCQLIELTGRVDALKYGKTYVQTANAFEFLSYIRNAESIVSTSFHGVAFSILFEKDFYALGMKNNSGRVASLLRQLDITHRLCEDDVMDSTPIDYNIVNNKLFHLKETSIKYLKHSLMV